MTDTQNHYNFDIVLHDKYANTYNWYIILIIWYMVDSSSRPVPVNQS